jgi:nucleoside-diphosphate-sugar epimerase
MTSGSQHADVLVTGASGFIGAYVLRELVRTGHQVVNADLRPPTGQAAWLLDEISGQITFAQVDVTHWSTLVDAFQRYSPRAVVHIAAIVDPIALDRNPSLAVDVNIGGAFNALEVSRLFGVERFVLFSSIGVLPPIQFEPITVDHPIFLADHGPNVSFYGAAKVAAEALTWSYHHAYGLDHMIVRPSAVYGFGQQYPIFIKPMVEGALGGDSVSFPTGRDFPRDYTHAADIAQLARLAVDAPSEQVRDRTFFGATGRPLVTAGELAAIVRELVPGAQIEVGDGLDHLQEIDVRCRGVLSIDNARAQLGYEPAFPDVRDGIADYIDHLVRYREST